MSARIVRMTAPLGKAILEKGIFCHPEADLPIKSEPAAAPKKRTASRRVNGLARKPCNSITTLLPCRTAWCCQAGVVIGSHDRSSASLGLAGRNHGLPFFLQ